MSAGLLQQLTDTNSGARTVLQYNASGPISDAKIKAALKEFSGLPRAEYDACALTLSNLQIELGQLSAWMFELAEGLDDVEALWDVENSALTLATAKQKLAQTESCVVLEGWAPIGRVDKITEVLGNTECAFEFA